MKKILVIDFWGLGDLILATGAIQQLADAGYQVGVLTKSISKKLVEPSFPDAIFHEINVPWTAHTGKYQLHKWKWGELRKIVRDLRKENYDLSVSIRADPREDFIPKLAGIKMVHGFKRWKVWPLINESGSESIDGHRVERWQELLMNITGEEQDCTPRLKNPAEMVEKRILLHVGASVKVRRWFLSQWQVLIATLKDEYDYPVEVISDLDGFGKDLKADKVYVGITLDEMCELLGGSQLVIGNDSGPTHIASAYGASTVTIFGPQKTKYFKPWSEKSFVVEGGECEFKPCSDYCKFSSAKCLEAVTVKQVMQEVKKVLNR